MIEQAKALLDSLAITFDFPILEFIRNYLTCDFLDKAMPYITLFGEWGAFWIAIAVILLLIFKHLLLQSDNIIQIVPKYQDMRRIAFKVERLFHSIVIDVIQNLENLFLHRILL